MLIDFTIKNYRSIKAAVTLSAVASTHARNVSEELIAKPWPRIGRDLSILPVIGIFGANASGKSNVLNALAEFLSFIYFGPDVRPDDQLSFVDPFRLDPNTVIEPVEFELRMSREGNIYSYSIGVDSTRICYERLDYIPQTSKRLVSRMLFDRTWDSERETYRIRNGKDFGKSFKQIQSSLRPSQAFLTLLMRGVTIPVIEPLTSWFAFHWAKSSFDDDFDYLMACHLLATHRPDTLERVKSIVRRFDLGVRDVSVELGKGEYRDALQNSKVWVTHNIGKKPVKWLLSNESLGTQKLFLLAAKLNHVMEMGGLMLVDEFGSSTHPHINREIIRLFQSHKTNSKRAQLLFSSHDATLLRKGVLRRDQIWYTEKQNDQSTRLFPLTEFSPRPDLATERAYLDGRLGAVPVIETLDEEREAYN